MSAFTHDDHALAQTYHRTSELQFERGKRLVERLGLSEGARVLDVGCGTGRLAQWMAGRVGPRGHVVGIDPVEERIQLARASEGAATFRVGRAEDLSAFDDASFDVVCMSSVLHWVDDKAKALAEVRRVLRPGGRVGVTTTPAELASRGTVRLVLASVLAREPYAHQVDPAGGLTSGKPGCTTTELVTLVVESGLELAEVDVRPDTHLHASGEAMVSFIEASAFGTFLQPVPAALRSSLRAELVAAFEAQRGPEGVALRSWSVVLTASRRTARS